MAVLNVTFAKQNIICVFTRAAALSAFTGKKKKNNLSVVVTG